MPQSAQGVRPTARGGQLVLTAAELPLTNASWIVSSVLALAVAAAPHAAAQSPKVQDPKAQVSKDRGDVVRQIETGKDTLRQSERRITTLKKRATFPRKRVYAARQE